MAQKKIPARQCIGCMTSRPKKELVRVVRAPAARSASTSWAKSPAAAHTSARTGLPGKGKEEKGAGALL